MTDTNLVPSVVTSLTSDSTKIADIIPAPVSTVDSTINSAVDPSVIASLLTSNDTKVVAAIPVPVINIDTNVLATSAVDASALAPSILAPSVLDTSVLKVDSVGLLGITDLSIVADNTTPSVAVTTPVLVTAPTVLDVVSLDMIGSKFQGLAEANTIDLSEYIGKTLKTDITTTSSAAYTNNIGFYVVEDAIGTIKLADGSTLKPGDANYAIEAIKNALTNSLQAAQADTKLGQDIVGGRIYAPVVIAQGSLTDFVSKNPSNAGGANDIHAYFNYIGANSDNFDHFKLLGNNTFGVEDMYGGGDKDFNDLVVNMNIKA